MGACANRGESTYGQSSSTFDDANLDDDQGGFAQTAPYVNVPSGASTCATAETEAKRTPVYMLVLLDGSGSMNDAPTEADPRDKNRQHGRKWLAAREALLSFVDQRAAIHDDTFAVGLFLFSSTEVKDPMFMDVPIKLVDAAQADALRARMLPPQLPSGTSPLLATFEGQLPIARGFTPHAPLLGDGKRVMVVVTDGVPDGGGADQDALLELASAAYAGTPQVTTFAVGVGDPSAPETGYDETFMSRLAVAGGAPASDCTPGWDVTSPPSARPCHLQVTPGTKTAAQIQSELLAAIDSIRGMVTSCELAIGAPPGSGPIDPAKVNVVFTDGAGKETTLSKDPFEGWSYDDEGTPKKVVLNGAACAALKSDPKSRVYIVLGCKTKDTR
jgi:hypothetical protein